jgi:hypothetical protein
VAKRAKKEATEKGNRGMTIQVPAEVQAQVEAIHRSSGVAIAKIRTALAEEVFSRPINLTKAVRERVFPEPEDSDVLIVGSDQPVRAQAEDTGPRAVPHASNSEMPAPKGGLMAALGQKKSAD